MDTRAGEKITTVRICGDAIRDVSVCNHRTAILNIPSYF
jgi:hypothetical protein